MYGITELELVEYRFFFKELACWLAPFFCAKKRKGGNESVCSQTRPCLFVYMYHGKRKHPAQRQGVSCSHVEFKFNWCQSGVKPYFLTVCKARKHRVYKGFLTPKASLWGISLWDDHIFSYVLISPYFIRFSHFLGCFLLISSYNFAVKWCQNWCQTGGGLTYPHFTLKISKACHFLFFGRLIVDIHRSLDVSMSHDFLDDFDVGFVLAESRAKCMPQIVCAEVR